MSTSSGGDWYYDGVIAAYKKGITRGVENDMFLPNENLSREQFITILMRLGEGRRIPAAGTRFTDVPYERWSSGSVALADERGIVNGLSEHYFGARLSITREAMAAMIARYLDHRSISLAEAGTPEAEFTDSSSVSPWAAEAVELMRKTGLMMGYEDDTFRPQGNATRAEAVVMLVRLLDEIGLRNIFELESTDVSRIVIKTDPVSSPGEHGQPVYSYTETEISAAADIERTVTSIASLEAKDSQLYEPEPNAGGSSANESIVFYGADGERLLSLIFTATDTVCSLEKNNVQEYFFDVGSLDFLKDYID